MQIKENISLKHFANYEIGGPARFFCEAKTTEDLLLGAQFAEEKKVPIFILGSGTNLLISDHGFNGLVIKISLNDIREEGGRMLRAGAGTLMSDVLLYAAKKGYGGLEWAGGLPGTLGGAVRGNAGAFGGEMKDVIFSVDFFNLDTLKIETKLAEECEFGYRSSIFKTRLPRAVILSAVMQFVSTEPVHLERVIREKMEYRKERHPLEYPNIGSIFKNIPVEKLNHGLRTEFAGVIKQDPFPVIPIALLISEAGLKGVSAGGAMISPKHPNFIVNVCDATSEDVRSLIHLVKEEMRSKFNITPEEEIIFLN